MTQNIYRATYDEASSELSEILARVEQLRLHRQLVEKAIEALEPFCVANGEAVAAFQPSVSIPAEVVRQQAAAEPIPFPVQEVVSNFDVPQTPPAPESPSDPFAARINSALWDWNRSSIQLQPAS
jgi:hypothetical protein